MNKTMNVAIYDGIKKVHMDTVPIPEIGPKDALVQVLRAGICGSDTGAYLHGGMYYGIYEGQQFGHEMVAKVVEKGAEVGDDVQIGDIVFVDPGKCKRQGQRMADMAGAFSEYVHVEDAQQGYNLYTLKPDIDLDAAVLVEPVAVGTQGAVLLDPKATDKIVVLGAGAIGLSAAAGLIARGIKNVAVVDRDASRLRKAQELGAIPVNTTEQGLKEQLCAIFGGVELMPGNPVPMVDLYVDAAGATKLLEECFTYSFIGTKYVILSVYFTDLVLSGAPFMLCRPLLTSSTGYEHDTILEVIDHITEEKTPIKTMVTRKFRHADFPEAIELASKAGENIKVIIDYEMK